LLTVKEGTILINLVRKYAITYLREGRKINFSLEAFERFSERFGVFVTIRKEEDSKKNIIACVGYPLPAISLLQASLDATLSATIRARCFFKVGADELEDMIFEITILTPLERIVVDHPIDYTKVIKLGRDGLMVERGFHKGLLLPNLPLEFGWSPAEFLGECCTRAGLLADSWLREDIAVYKFQVQTFSREPNGRIVKLGSI